jgi:uncharacterized repeat protein (TIGR03803 family)
MLSRSRILSASLLLLTASVFGAAQHSYWSRTRAARPLNQSGSYSLSVIGSFNSPESGTDSAFSGLIQASDGGLYGTTFAGGANGYGTVFVTGPGLAPTSIYAFCSAANCADGSAPQSGIMEASDGYLYGTTNSGGAYAAGTIFRLSLSGGAETVLYSFCNGNVSGCPDGQLPSGSLVQAADGKLYGTTFSGGANNCGVLFSVDPAGSAQSNYSYTVLYTFGAIGRYDGAQPRGALVQGADGYLYGTTEFGGTLGSGSIFRYSPSGGAYSLLYSFCAVSNCTDGILPFSGLTQMADGSFWGTAAAGGGADYGDAYRWDGSSLTDEADFSPANGDTPEAPLFLASDGTLYSAAYVSGAYDGGSLFQVVPGTSPTVNYLYQFGQDGTANGQYVEGGLLQAFDGNFYGMTLDGGSKYAGTVFQLSPPSELGGPVQLELYPAPTYTPQIYATIMLGQSISLGWGVSNAFSTSMQQCFASVLPESGNASGAGNWSGLQAGTLSNGIYNQSVSLTPTQVGGFTYVLTCGGVESGASFLQVMGTPAIAASAAPSTVTTGGALTLNVTAGPSIHTLGPAPTGTLSFTVGGVAQGTATLVNGAASWAPNITGLAAGTYTVAVNYAGDSNYVAASTTVPVTVQKANTTTTLAVSSNAVSQGQPVTVTATVTGADGTIPAGKVDFATATGYSVGSAPLNGSGVATLTYNSPASILGPYTGRAMYAGSNIHNPSTSNPESVTISKAPTSVSVTASPNPVTSPGSVTFTVTVTRTASGATGNPGGNVSLTYAGKTLGSQALNAGGVATLTVPTTNIPAQSYPVGATYYGDKGDLASTAAPISVTVN